MLLLLLLLWLLRRQWQQRQQWLLVLLWLLPESRPAAVAAVGGMGCAWQHAACASAPTSLA
jgi:hypothetical protein